MRSGRAAGGLAYGYRVVNTFDARGNPVRGLREIDDERADIVRRIYAEYLAGRSPRLIAAGLNRDGMTPPRGRLWNATTINGYGKRGSGILHNELYAGLIVWNKNRKLLNPYTGKRVGRPNDAADRQVVEVEPLRIIDQDTWQAVQALKASKAGTGRNGIAGRCISSQGSCAAAIAAPACRSKTATITARSVSGALPSRKRALREPAGHLPAAHRGGCRRRDARPTPRPAPDRDLRNPLQRNPPQAGDYGRARARDRLRGRPANMSGCYRHTRFVSEADAEAQLPALRQERDRLAAELATANQPANVVALHPGLIADYLRQVEDWRPACRARARAGGERCSPAPRRGVPRPRPISDGSPVPGAAGFRGRGEGQTCRADRT